MLANEEILDSNEIKLPKRELQEIFLRAGKLIKKDINSKTTHSVS